MTTPHGSTRRARLLGVGLLVMMFMAGGLTGMAMTQALEAKEGPAVASPAPQECRSQKKRILDQLSLTPEQSDRVHGILERRREQTEAFWDSAGPRLEHLMDATRAEIRTVLTPEQQALYDRLRAERRAERERERQREKECEKQAEKDRD